MNSIKSYIPKCANNFEKCYATICVLNDHSIVKFHSETFYNWELY
jgi:hypothetical protein